MNNKHTPGPWLPMIKDEGLWVEPANRSENVICDVLPRRLGAEYVAEYSPEDIANTRLLALAPEMKGLLMEIEAWLSFNQTPSRDNTKQLRETINHLISKLGP